MQLKTEVQSAYRIFDTQLDGVRVSHSDIPVAVVEKLETQNPELYEMLRRSTFPSLSGKPRPANAPVAEMIKDTRKVLRKGTRLPTIKFTDFPSPTFEFVALEVDLYLHEVTGTPYSHVLTGWEFPELVVNNIRLADKLLIYKDTPERVWPTVPDGYSRFISDHIGYEVPTPANWNLADYSLPAFERRNIGDQPYEFFCYGRGCGLWSGRELTEEQMEFHFLNNACGFRHNSNGEVYIWGTDAPGYSEYPYHNMSPIPASSIYCRVEEASGQVNGQMACIRGLSGATIRLPESKPLPKTLTPIPKLLVDTLTRERRRFDGGMIRIWPPKEAFSGKVDGSWYIGKGGCNLP